jgi:hypothetical protein
MKRGEFNKRLLHMQLKSNFTNVLKNGLTYKILVHDKERTYYNLQHLF